MAHAGGRPLKFKTVQELQDKIDAYFFECDPHVIDVTEWVDARDSKGQLKKDENGLNYLVEVTHKVRTVQVPYTITGLALALDTSRRTLLDYELGNYDSQGNELPLTDEEVKFSHTIKKAKLKIQNYLEKNLQSTSPTGTIFNLKNNFDWRDKTEQDITSDGERIQSAPIIISEIKPRNTEE